ncbi:deoxyribodipyrimidine photolyase [Roseiconus nitratireducens]|uniref:Deoxyribodipyrimidine photo-lyase n=2 Tax=Roseiconus nitratireducens TaxID=2605748 RepID=A0A5M6CYX9_9BACT|nr:deoxyribodipyrimidine photolyase [Roseiconus nitratireducens]KAA5539630.1 deoxyribodipyrimidine photolyase [Roseiconus nitratireducens]
MIASRRTHHNFALQHAVDRARSLGKPLVIFEPLRVRYRWASDRIHRFIIEGMRDNRAALLETPVTYYPYVEPEPGHGTPLLAELSQRACTVVTDEYPCFFLPRMIAAVKDKLPSSLELVDSNGIIPLRLPEKTFTVAHSFRRWIQKNVLDCLLDQPVPNPLAGIDVPELKRLPSEITKRWQPADLESLLAPDGLADLAIDHSVPPSPVVTGGSVAAGKRLADFLSNGLARYGTDRNHPDEHATTGLSPHLHFGHIAAHEIVQRILDQEQWTPDQIGPPAGKNNGFWNTSEAAEGFLDQIITWRELGFNLAFRQPDDYDKFDSLPQWARKSMEETRDDPRPVVYTLEQFERAETHDPLWNAAQRELVRHGVMHNYLRMLWGKKILQWTETPRQALQVMIHLNNKYGLDGRDPNSYSGIFWVLGRYDRAWGPKRPIFGKLRYMTSDSARKKLRLKRYLARFGA